MANAFSVPIDMETLAALGFADIGYDDSLNHFDPQSTSYQFSELFGYESFPSQPYTSNGDTTATSVSCADIEQVGLPMDIPNHLSIFGPPSQTLQPEEMVPTSSATNDIAASIVTQFGIPRTWATENDWSRHRALITELYGENKLPKVMSIMESQQGFKATLVDNSGLCMSG